MYTNYNKFKLFLESYSRQISELEHDVFLYLDEQLEQGMELSYNPKLMVIEYFGIDSDEAERIINLWRKNHKKTGEYEFIKENNDEIDEYEYSHIEPELDSERELSDSKVFDDITMNKRILDIELKDYDLIKIIFDLHIKENGLTFTPETYINFSSKYIGYTIGELIDDDVISYDTLINDTKFNQYLNLINIINQFKK